jgi:hypothetical protein
MSGTLGRIFEPFVKQRPICVMARGIVENLFHPDRLDALFRRTAEVQYTRDLMFSSVVDLMGQVVLGVHPSVHAAYQAQAEKLGVSDQAVYDKLNGIELGVSEELVRDSARQAELVIRELKGALPPLLRGYRAKILDGNHLAASERRIAELRGSWASPLPGALLVVLEQELMLASEVFLTEDGHAQERALLDEVLAVVREKDLWLADRNFCTRNFLCDMDARGGCFVIRQHGHLSGELLGRPQAKGRISTGKVYEQAFRVTSASGEVLILRRVTVRLDKPTRDEDTEIHLLSNVPVADATARKLAEIYGKRWTIETMFQELTETLTCEVNALGYPKAALFGFCLALLAYHAVSVIKAALRAVHSQETVDKQLSSYYLSLEISQTYDGMMVAIPSRHWRVFSKLDVQGLAGILTDLAKNISLRRYQKHPRGPKKKSSARAACKKGSHVSTSRILAGRK